MTVSTVDLVIKIFSISLLVGVLLTFVLGFMFAWFKSVTSRPYLNKTRQQIQLIDKVTLSHDTFRLRFSLPSNEFYIGLPPGQHIKFIGPNREGKVPGEWNGAPDSSLGTDEIQRKYTPVTGDEFMGFVDFVIKVYRQTPADSNNKKGSNIARFVDGGKLTQYIEQLAVGDVVDIMGPFGLLTYHGKGRFTYGKQEKTGIKKIGMLAGGTGITPMLQIIKSVLRNPEDEDIQISLVFANKTEEDIIVRDLLEEYSQLHPNRLKIWYTIDRLDSSNDANSGANEWKYSVGYINEEIIKDHLFPPSEDCVVLMCGPKVMVDNCCKKNLEKLEYDPAHLFTF